MRHQLALNCAASAGLFGAGDVLAQWITGSSYDSRKTTRAAAYGGLIFGPVAAGVFFPFLNRLAAGRSKLQQAVARTAVDQGVVAPFVYLPLYFGAMPLLEGRGVAAAEANVADHWPNVVLTNAAVWVPVQLVNFALVPPAARLLVVNTVSVGWAAYLASQNSRQSSST